MRQLALSLGVPGSACLLEEDSHSTHENAVNTARLLASRDIRKVVLITDRFHLFRARQEFRLQGVDAKALGANPPDRSVSVRARLYWSAREFLALARRPSLFWVWHPRPPRSEPNGEHLQRS
jgi:uncharacterized SAM-binding protein YcdF (DUF218 family)